MAAGPATVLFVHSSSGRYGADRQLRLLAGGLDRDRYTPLVALPSEGPLADDLRAVEVEVFIRPLAVIRRELVHPRGVASIVAQAVADATGLGRIARERGVSLVHSNTSVVLGGAAAAAARRVPHVWHVREIYDRFARVWPVHRTLLGTASALPCVSAATAAQFSSDRVRVMPDGLAGAPARAPRAGARRALGLDAEVPVLAVLGRIRIGRGRMCSSGRSPNPRWPSATR